MFCNGFSLIKFGNDKMTVDDAENYTLQHMYDHVRFDPCKWKVDHDQKTIGSVKIAIIFMTRFMMCFCSDQEEPMSKQVGFYTPWIKYIIT